MSTVMWLLIYYFVELLSKKQHSFRQLQINCFEK